MRDRGSNRKLAWSEFAQVGVTQVTAGKLAVCNVLEKARLRSDDVGFPVGAVADVLDRLIRVPDAADGCSTLDV